VNTIIHIFEKDIFNSLLELRYSILELKNGTLFDSLVSEVKIKPFQFKINTYEKH